ncbi:hypothetical protein [Rheinheimera sp.]|uniref:hypothetical protein n=1 Tax=Rheinheimera sp. TaxID=1869214 RepID=UPI003AF4D7AD
MQKLLIYSRVGSVAAEKAKPTQTRREYIPCRLGFGIPAKDGLLSSLPSLALDRFSSFTVLVQVNADTAP